MPAVGVFRSARPGPPPQPARELAGHGSPGGSPNGHRRRPSGLRLALLPGGRLANPPPQRETAAAGAPRPSLPRRVRWCGLMSPGRSRRRDSPRRRTGGRAAGQPGRHPRPRPRRDRRVRRDQPGLRRPRPRPRRGRRVRRDQPGPRRPRPRPRPVRLQQPREPRARPRQRLRGPRRPGPGPRRRRRQLRLRHPACPRSPVGRRQGNLHRSLHLPRLLLLSRPAHLPSEPERATRRRRR